MALIIKDGSGNVTNLRTIVEDGEHIPYHGVVGSVQVRSAAATSVTRTRFYSGVGSIDWASTNLTNVSGTFIIADSSSTRSALMFSNNTNQNLYVAIGNGDYALTNGFALNDVDQEPVDYTFIVYPSGTYTSDSSFVSVKHSGFFVSSSANLAVQVVSCE